MKQINDCLDRFFENKPPLKKKWLPITHDNYPNCLILFHYHHLVLVYDLNEKKPLYQWWELPTDKRGLDAALDYLKNKFKTSN